MRKVSKIKPKKGLTKLVYGLSEEELEEFNEFKKAQAEAKEKPTLKKSLLNFLNGKTTDNSQVQALAFDIDPKDQGGNRFGSLYRTKTQLLPDPFLKRIASQDSLVSTIVRARQNHMTPFGRPRDSRHSIGYTFEPDQGLTENMSQEEKEELNIQIKKAVNKLWTCGEVIGHKESNMMSFSECLHILTRSAMTVGRIAVELIQSEDADTGEKKFHSFRPRDAGTIYRIIDNGDNDAQEESIRRQGLMEMFEETGQTYSESAFKNKNYTWVQVIDGRPVQVFTDDEMSVCNFFPVPDIENNGYPLTPIDMAVKEITTHINITTHNLLYFQNGRATKGMLILQSEDATPEVIHQIKQNFNASINSVGKCIDGSTTILVNGIGNTDVASYVGECNEKAGVIWTPFGWQPGLVYKTGIKPLNETTFSNGVTIKTSPEHRIRTIDENGNQVWKKQSELFKGDFVLINGQNVQDGHDLPNIFGQELSEDLAEVLGWIAGDGYIGDRSVELYYHPEKEDWIRQRHIQILHAAGINSAKLVDTAISEEEQDEICRKYGFKTTASRRIEIVINSKEIVDELIRTGFTKSKRGVDRMGKTVPAFLYTAPEAIKSAFLMGLFSADGNNEEKWVAKLTCANHRMREQVKYLLLSMGIRTSLSEGKSKRPPGTKELVQAKSYLKIKDRESFFEKIGFLQSHKQPKELDNKNRAAMKDRIPVALAQKWLKIIKDKTKLPRGGHYHNVGLYSVFTRREQMDLDELLRGDRICSKPRLLRLAQRAEVQLPEWLINSHFEQVVETKETGQSVEMFDVSISNPNHKCQGLECDHEYHSFYGNSVHLSNSHRMPVFGCGIEEKITWQPLDAGGAKDMEFQYLIDHNARCILSAFMISPDELPGYSHLSKGTNSQSLSEANSEYKLEAARDLGIRPMISTFQDFINRIIFPRIDPDLAGKGKIKLSGLDTDNPEREAIRTTQDQSLWMTYDKVLERMEQKPMGEGLGGSVPLNPIYRSTVLDVLFTVGQILEKLCGVKGAASDPKYAYIRDPFWFQQQQLLIQQQQMAIQQQQAQQAMAMGQPPPGQGGPDGPDGGSGGPPGAGGGPDKGPDSNGSESSDSSGPELPSSPNTPDGSANQETPDNSSAMPGEDLSRSIDQAMMLLSKSESYLPPAKKKLLVQHRKTVSHIMDSWVKDLEVASKEIMEAASKHKPKN